jgi:hypothetical protein
MAKLKDFLPGVIAFGAGVVGYALYRMARPSVDADPNEIVGNSKTLISLDTGITVDPANDPNIVSVEDEVATAGETPGGTVVVVPGAGTTESSSGTPAAVTPPPAVIKPRVVKAMNTEDLVGMILTNDQHPNPPSDLDKWVAANMAKMDESAEIFSILNLSTADASGAV